MPQPKLKYTLYRASNGAETFWRWEVYRFRRQPLESGTLFGSVDDAKRRVEVVISRLTHANENPDNTRDRS
jgi:hypothetical protein